MKEDIEKVIEEYFISMGYKIRQVVIDEIKEMDSIDFSGKITIRVQK